MNETVFWVVVAAAVTATINTKHGTVCRRSPNSVYIYNIYTLALGHNK